MLRQTLGRESVHIVAFATYAGTVTAAREWGDTPQQYVLTEALRDSHEAVLSMAGAALGTPMFVVDLRDDRTREALRDPRLMRAVGVVYRPDTERQSHYFEARGKN
jgi:erythromycin esterase-like protein